MLSYEEYLKSGDWERKYHDAYAKYRFWVSLGDLVVNLCETLNKLKAKEGL